MPWRNLDLEIVFGGPLDAIGLTEAAVDRIVSQSVQESEVLDFKKELWIKGGNPNWPDELEFAKDVSALANHKGGIVLVGVDEAKRAAISKHPIPATVDSEAEERRLRAALINHQAPLATCEFVWIPVGAGGHYLAVVVPNSPRAPHAVVTTDRRRPIRYPLRHGQDTNWLTEPEVADRYRRRFEGQADAAERHARISLEGFDAIQTTDGVWLFVTITPESPASIRLDRIIGEEIDKWYWTSKESSPLDRHIAAHGTGIAAPGRMTFTGSPITSADDEAAVRDAYVELHADGSAYAAVPVAFHTSDQAVDDRTIGEITLVDDGILLVDLATRWTAHQVGPWGGGTLTIGLLDTDSEDGTLEVPVELVASHGGGLRRVRRTRALRGGIRSTVTLDLSAVSTAQERLAVTHAALSGIFQAFGMPEPLQLRSNGGIVARQFDVSRYRQVEQWANDRGIEIVEPLRSR